MPKTTKNATDAKFSKNNSMEIVDRNQYSWLDLPHCHNYGVPSPPDDFVQQTTCAVPLFKQLVGAQIDGVSVNSSSLLQRQYDDDFGGVDPASDIHTDSHLLADSLMRRSLDDKIISN